LKIPFTIGEFLLIRPQIIDHQLVDDDKSSIVDEITKPMSTLNTTNLVKSSKEIDNDEKKKEKSSDLYVK
jgi:hypothetical protein